MSAAVGADIEALCAKCGDTWHVVVAKDDTGKIAKVQCKMCNAYHRYRSVHGASAQAKLPAAKRTPKPTKEKAPVERFEKPAVAADLSRPARPYSARDKYGVGDRIDHPNFGQGVVEVSELGKITVFFAGGRRVLAQSKEGEPRSDSLTRPKPFDHSNTAGGKPVGET